MQSIEKANVSDITVVVGPHMKEVSNAVKPHKTVIQQECLGTANAALSAAPELAKFKGCALILYGDTPLIQPETIHKMLEKCHSGTDVVVLGFVPNDPRRYGRLIMGPDGLEAIVEYKDATESQRSIRLCNSGMMCINGEYILSLLKKIKNKNTAGEYYLTDIVSIARKSGLKCDTVIGSAEELHGVNTPEELETAEQIYIKRTLKK
jgi:bifunctional UDP-N-acetylglucosamine pyrophosphorylase/glucosamine-1-phosphate N-acetyltransferase